MPYTAASFRVQESAVAPLAVDALAAIVLRVGLAEA